MKHYIIARAEKTRNGNVRPFTKVESQFTHATFFEDSDAPNETIPSTISFTGKVA